MSGISALTLPKTLVNPSMTSEGSEAHQKQNVSSANNMSWFRNISVATVGTLALLGVSSVAISSLGLKKSVVESLANRSLSNSLWMGSLVIIAGVSPVILTPIERELPKQVLDMKCSSEEEKTTLNQRYVAKQIQFRTAAAVVGLLSLAKLAFDHYTTFSLNGTCLADYLGPMPMTPNPQFLLTIKEKVADYLGPMPMTPNPQFLLK